jgi:hypothetical protein
LKTSVAKDDSTPTAEPTPSRDGRAEGRSRVENRVEPRGRPGSGRAHRRLLVRALLRGLRPAGAQLSRVRARISPGSPSWPRTCRTRGRCWPFTTCLGSTQPVRDPQHRLRVRGQQPDPAHQRRARPGERLQLGPERRPSARRPGGPAHLRRLGARDVQQHPCARAAIDRYLITWSGRNGHVAAPGDRNPGPPSSMRLVEGVNPPPPRAALDQAPVVPRRIAEAPGRPEGLRV